MRVLVTGGAGYIGAHTVLELLQAGHRLAVIDTLDNSTDRNIQSAAALTGHSVALHRADIRDAPAVTAIMDRFRPDAVVHIAGLKDAAASFADPVGYFDVNLGGTVALLSAMQTAGCAALVFSSSASVYGQPECLPIDEDHPCRPVSPYGETKLAAERLIKAWASAAPDRTAVILRYFNPAGLHPSGRLVPVHRTGPVGVLDRINAAAHGKTGPFEIFGDDYDTRDGTGLRDYLHVSDLARAHVAALAQGRAPDGADVINLGSGRGYTVLELLRAFETHTGLSVPCRIRPRRRGDISQSWCATAKAHKALSWKAELTLRDICRSVSALSPAEALS